MSRVKRSDKPVSIVFPSQWIVSHAGKYHHTRMEQLGDIGEHEAIRRLTASLGCHPLLRVGAGDDCAVAEVPGTHNDQVFTTDPVIEGVHFQSGERPERIGNKAAGRVLSDIAAMGAQPRWLLVNAVAPADLAFDTLDRIYAGMNALCERFGAVIVGGDLARGACLELHVFGTGILPAGTAMLRSGAMPGDTVVITGALGCSREGRHLDFMPRVEEGIFLRESGLVTAMMDVSDGLATDLRHILAQSRVGAVLGAEQIPKKGTLHQALYDGEDFELLFTVASGRVERLSALWEDRFGSRLFPIGTVTDEANVLNMTQKGEAQVIDAKAFEHFSDK